MVKFDVASTYCNIAATYSAVQNLAKLTLLPMLSYIFSFNDSVAWSPKQTLMQPQFLWIPSKPYLSPDGYRCHFFLAPEVLAPSTHQVHLSAQRHYINFCPVTAVLVPEVLFSQLTSWTSCILPCCWCTSAQCSLFTVIRSFYQLFAASAASAGD